MKDVLGRETRYSYDSKGNLLSMTEPNGSTTRYEYNPVGQLVALIDGENNRVDFKHDAAGRVTEQINQAGQKRTWSFDSQGRLTQRTNGVQVIDFYYDKRGNLIKTDYGHGQVISNSYDESGRIISCVTPTITLKYHYSPAGQILAREMIRGSLQRVLRQDFDANGRRVRVTLSERTMPEDASDQTSGYAILQQTGYSYDGTGRVTEIYSNGSSACKFLYDPVSGQLKSRIYGNGATAHYLYDELGRMTQLKVEGGPLEDPLTLAYAWDAPGQVVARSWNGEAQYYKYDGAGQLIEVRGGPVELLRKAVSQGRSVEEVAKLVETYAYDQAGNITQKVTDGVAQKMSYDPANQLAEVLRDNQRTPVEYDKAGRVAKSNIISNVEYGYLDKILHLKRQDGGEADFDYYPDGQLASMQTANETEEYVWDGLGLIYRKFENVVDTAALEPSASGGVPVARSKNGKVYYVINDMLGTTLAQMSDDELNLGSLNSFGQPTKLNLAQNSKENLLSEKKPNIPDDPRMGNEENEN